MELTPGTRLGPYEILGPLGAGGMGQVYRARDMNLGRPVAIKVLHDDSGSDPVWRARFEREARLLAALTHPNIATVHGLDETEALRYLVMELVPGQTLAKRLAAGPMPIDEALGVCRQIAEALEAAHDRGIIHRDLKPANVMLTPEGKVKILDFGLARSAEPLDTPADAAVVPDEAQTAQGVIMGTAAYMAPEQARAQPLDRRCDVWAFGCVLFEVLTGQQAFAGTTFHDTLAAVLEHTPAWDRLPADVPPRLVELLRRCLQKDMHKRLRDAGDIRLELEEAIAERTTGTAANPLKGPAPLAVKQGRARRWWSAPVAAAVVLAAFALGRWSHPVAPPGPPATPGLGPGQLLLGGATRAFQPRVSPDGKWLAFIMLHEGQAQVGVMALDSGEWWVLTRNRTRGQVQNVCWARDSTRLYFDRFFDVPGGVYSVSPLDRAADGAREAPVVKDADSPQVAADGSLIVCKLDPEGRYRFHRHSADGDLRPVGPPFEAPGRATPARTLRMRNELVFCGKVLDGKAPPQRGFYLLSLDTSAYRALTAVDIGPDFVPLAVSARDQFVYTVLPAQDAFHLVRFALDEPLAPQPLLTLTTQAWNLDLDASDRLYMDQVQRPVEVLCFNLPATDHDPTAPLPVERLAVPSLWRETGTLGQPLPLPDGRVVLPSRASGRDQLLVVHPGKAPVPLLVDSRAETEPPVALVGPNRLAFVVGSGTARRLRIARLEEGHVSLEPTDLKVEGEGLTALAGTPGGKTLYYVKSRQVYAVPADGSRPPAKVVPGDGVAVNPGTAALLIQRFEKAGVRLFRLPRTDGALGEVEVAPGRWRLASFALGSGAIDRDGRVLVTTTARDAFFWTASLLDPAGKLHPLPAAFDGDVFPAGWSPGGKILATGYALRSELWRFALQEAAPP